MKINLPKQLLLIATTILFLNSCNFSTSEQRKSYYNPEAGEPDLRLMSGTWKGTGETNYGAKFVADFYGSFEMNGDRAGQMDVFTFTPLNNNGEPNMDIMADKLYVSPTHVTFATKTYPASIWDQVDSINFSWKLLSNEFNDNQIGTYRDFVTIKRARDSLFIISGRLIQTDSTIDINSYRRLRISE